MGEYVRHSCRIRCEHGKQPLVPRQVGDESKLYASEVFAHRGERRGREGGRGREGKKDVEMM